MSQSIATMEKVGAIPTLILNTNIVHDFTKQCRKGVIINELFVAGRQADVLPTIEGIAFIIIKAIVK